MDSAQLGSHFVICEALVVIKKKKKMPGGGPIVA